MKTTGLFLVTFLTVASILTAQKKQIELEELWNGTFRQERLQALQSLDNGKEYVVQNYNRATQSVSVDKYSYKTGEKTGTLIDSKNIPELNYFQSYTLSENENKALLATQLQQIYRRSAKGIYYVYDLQSEKLTQVSDKNIQEPSFSPDASKVAYVYNNNIYVKNLENGETKQITFDGIENKIINGITDWVYEEEFAFVQAYEWNKTGDKIAYLRFDEEEVPEFSMDVYGTYGKQLYPQQDVFKYPKAGEKNAEVSLHIYDWKTEESSKIDFDKDYEYLPRLKWSNDNQILSVQATNRHQNKLDLLFVNTKDNSTELVLEETDEAYIDVTDNLTFLNDNSFIWTSEKDGWNHIYHYGKDGDLIKQITKGNWEVTNYYGFDPQTGRIHYQSTENGSINRDVFSIMASGKNKAQLTQRRGTNSADFSADFTYFINTYSSVSTPNVYTLHLARNGKLVRKIKDNSKLEEKLEDYKISKKELSTININGNDLNMSMIKPLNFDPEKKYAVLMYQYSGPGSQSVSNSFLGTNDYWYQMLANAHDIIVVTVDGRGTGFKGAEFKKVTQKELGKLELEDQIAAAKKLAQREYIDANRIGIWGWSFGGFMSSNAIFQAGNTFELAIAVAPVTSWRFYDSIYTERYMTTPQENPSGYDQNSPITHVNEFDDSNHYLLVHGSADDNVHVQNTMQLIEALVQENKQFDWRIYPDKNHGIYGGNTRLHLYTLMTNFLKENL
ncbi:S9 family peptidase [Haloflavibacter putidus]|uniref:S9 family peptidase n=1 Tax=Haloflavibacter putidus TaxID=2576776 RepID=A0A507ZUQ4_9FLAO|nr:S9 family peptidase [Haloflavibacter putidus]TQD38535.1 S9 family peptidase [Haloflavibacter putidus]